MGLGMGWVKKTRKEEESDDEGWRRQPLSIASAGRETTNDVEISPPAAKVQAVENQSSVSFAGN